MQYVRIYTGSDGETHFEDLEIELKEVNFAPPAPPVQLSAFTAARQWGSTNSFSVCSSSACLLSSSLVFLFLLPLGLPLGFMFPHIQLSFLIVNLLVLLNSIN